LREERGNTFITLLKERTGEAWDVALELAALRKEAGLSQ
jgi:hypothetical protein